VRFPYAVLSKSTSNWVHPDGKPPIIDARKKFGVALYDPPMADCDPTPAATQSPAGNTSGRMVHCVKFQKELPGLDAPPWPGELGQRIYENVSVQAWKMWEDRMKMILNEYRLMPWQKEAQELIARHMEDFFFGQGAALPPGYVPQQTK
jgi:Fe-S cluster biosynthesis and repair protein YggX